jgi:hypothetical protein
VYTQWLISAQIWKTTDSMVGYLIFQKINIELAWFLMAHRRIFAVLFVAVIG